MIIAIIIMAVITGLAFNFTSQFQLTLLQLNNRITLSRIQQCLFTIESGAMYFLREDKRNDVNDGFTNGRDHLDEEFWSKQDNLEGVQLAAQAECFADEVKLDLVDSGRRFNLNWLTPNTDQNPNAPFEKRYSGPQKQFIRLLQTRKNAEDSALVSPAEAEQITDAVIDWIDENSDPWASGGAETAYYQSLDKPYRAANQEFTSVSELLLVKGFEQRQELYKEMKPLLIALPAQDYTTLNVNTMPEQLARIINTNDSEKHSTC